MLKFSSVQFFPKFQEPRVEHKVQFRGPAELWTGLSVQVQGLPVQVQCQFEPKPNVLIQETINFFKKTLIKPIEVSLMTLPLP